MTGLLPGRAGCLVLCSLLGGLGVPTLARAAAVQLPTSHLGNIHYPQPSPDGSKLVYEVDYPSEKRMELQMADLGPGGMGAPRLLVPETMGTSDRYGAGRRITHLFGWAAPQQKYGFAYTVSDAQGLQSVYIDGWSTMIAEGVNKEPTWAPEGARFVFTSNRTGNGDLYLWDEGQELQLTFDEVHSEIYPAWTPQGDKLAFVRAGKGPTQIMLLELSGFSPVPLLSFPGKDSTRPSFSPDGSKVAFLSNKATDSPTSFGLWVVDARPGGTPRSIGPKVRVPTKGACSWTPDGKAVIAVLDDPDAGDPIGVFPIDGGPVRILATGTVNNWDPRLVVRDGQWRLYFTSQGLDAADDKVWQTLWVYDIPR